MRKNNYKKKQEVSEKKKKEGKWSNDIRCTAVFFEFL